MDGVILKVLEPMQEDKYSIYHDLAGSLQVPEPV